MSNQVIIGVDEVGRGCIAGDLLVCAYVLRQDITGDEIASLRQVAMDSKAFSSRKKREAAIPEIEAAGIFAFARRTPEDIEASNIRAATLDAMREAAGALRRAVGEICETLVIFDGNDIPDGVPAPVEALVKGDALVLEISCASVLAKVKRDREMEQAGKLYPGYGFEAHAGYGTRQHREAIGKLGLCPIHRSWAAKFV
jgi:ribonuclease HII